MASKTEKLDEIRQKIIDSAAQRFQRFGYGKTNVAEIACDCGMSAGNLYRYFKNKSQIAETIMRMSLDSTLAELKSVLDIPDISAGKRLEEFFLQELYFTHHQLNTYPTLLEHVRDPNGSGPMMGEEYMEASRALLVQILAMGVEQGEFQIDDLEEMARTIQSATLKFRYSQLHTNQTLEELEPSAHGVIKLILRALATPAAAKNSVAA